jgi:hypothetical protein
MAFRPKQLLPTLIGAALTSACADSTAPVSNVRATSAIKSRFDVTATVSVFATGLLFPRGMTFGPTGILYVAEAGSGGGNATTAQQCAQVVPPVGPYTSAPTARISAIDRNGTRTTLAQGFPSGVNQFGDVMGVADVAFQGGQLYALVAGGGCSHGSATVPAGIARVSLTGQWDVVANLSQYQAANPVANPFAGDYEPDGSWFSMIQSGSSLIAVEPNHGEAVRVNPRSGDIDRLVDFSALFGHIVPTVVAERSGDYYVSALGGFPVSPGSQKIYRVSGAGEVEVWATGFTAVLGLDFDHSGDLYVLESTTAPGFPAPMTGRVVRLDKHGGRSVIVDGLFLPTSLRVGPDDALYISNIGFGPPIPGQILRVVVNE